MTQMNVTIDSHDAEAALLAIEIRLVNLAIDYRSTPLEDEEISALERAAYALGARFVREHRAGGRFMFKRVPVTPSPGSP